MYAYHIDHVYTGATRESTTASSLLRTRLGSFRHQTHHIITFEGRAQLGHRLQMLHKRVRRDGSYRLHPQHRLIAIRTPPPPHKLAALITPRPPESKASRAYKLYLFAFSSSLLCAGLKTGHKGVGTLDDCLHATHGSIMQ